MKNLRQKADILNKLEKFISNAKLNESNLDIVLSELKIAAPQFYLFFPHSIYDLCIFYFEEAYFKCNKKIKQKMKKEKSVSKKSSMLVSEFLTYLNKNESSTIFFLNYAFVKPLLLNKIIFKISSNIWYDIGDTSTDFNYYSKRLILLNIIKNDLYYWRKTKSLNETLHFNNKQIIFFGKLGKFKFKTKSYLKEKLRFFA